MIHTVGPVWNNGGKNKENLLQNCYRNVMELAIAHCAKTIAFPCISTGIYRFPKELAATIAVDTISSYKDQIIVEEVIFVCFEKEDFMCYERLLKNEISRDKGQI